MSFVHETAVVDPGAHVGAETRVWHFAHVMAGAWIGDRGSIGQGCFIGNVRIGHGCRIQNHVSIFDGVTLEDDVFLGPSCVFTNVPAHAEPVACAVAAACPGTYTCHVHVHVHDVRHPRAQSRARTHSRARSCVAASPSGRTRRSCAAARSSSTR